MPRRKTARSVLEKLVYRTQNLMGRSASEEVAQALASLQQVLVPEGKQGIKCHTGRIGSELSEYSPTDNQKVGWNSCRREILKRFDNQPNGGGGERCGKINIG